MNEIQKIEQEFDRLKAKIKELFHGHPHVDTALSHIDESKDALTILPPPTQAPNQEEGQGTSQG